MASGNVNGHTVNELLCCVVSKFLKMTVNQLKSLMRSFYTDDELLVARDVLISSVDAVTGPSITLSRYAKRKGDSKGRMLVDDILDILSFADEHKLLDMLPSFVAANLDRVPTVKADDLDLFIAARHLDALEQKLETAVHLGSLLPNLSRLESILDSIDKAGCVVSLIDKISALELKLVTLESAVDSRLTGPSGVQNASSLALSSTEGPQDIEPKTNDISRGQSTTRWADCLRSSDNDAQSQADASNDDGFQRVSHSKHRKQSSVVRHGVQ